MNVITRIDIAPAGGDDGQHQIWLRERLTRMIGADEDRECPIIFLLMLSVERDDRVLPYSRVKALQVGLDEPLMGRGRAWRQFREFLVKGSLEGGFIFKI